MKMWTLNELKNHLSQRQSIKTWTIVQEHTHRRERYFLLDSPGGALAIDQDRDVRSQNILLKIAVPSSKSGRQGEVSKKLFPSMSISPQIDSAIEAASLTDHQAWDLSAVPPSDLPRVQSADPKMQEDIEGVVIEMTRAIETAVSKSRDTAFNSAELFLSVHDREMHLSNGVTHRSSQSRIYAEAAYSYSRRNKQGEIESDEYLSSQWAVHRDDIKIAQLFDETSDRAQHSLDVVKSLTGNYPVIVDSEVLATLFNAFASQLTATNAYNSLPFIAPGSELIPGAYGDRIHLTLDPSLPFGADAAAISRQGVPQKALVIVENGIVQSTATDKQHGDYLGKPATTVCGDWVVALGSRTHAQLTQAQPLVLEILQFSGLFVDPNSATFSSEIRLGRLYDNRSGKITYIKGGSLSGSIRENFKDLRLSNQRVKRAHFSSGEMQGHGYAGPEFALLSGVSVVG